jgi:hypothetical protein
MKLVAISRVKNEVDVIEPFLRHHAKHFDTIIVLDDGSTDGSFEIMQSLQGKGLPVVVLREPCIGYEQSYYMTRLLRTAFDEFGADWVAPLDADEFIEPPAGMSLAQALQSVSDDGVTIDWSNFVWRTEDDASSEPNPVRRLRLRVPTKQTGLAKALLSSRLATKPQLRLAQGNHSVWSNGEQIPLQPLEAVSLCHFPIRSVAQYAGKIAIGYLQYCATPHWKRDEGFQYVDAFELLKDGLDHFTQAMEAHSRRYSLHPWDPPQPDPVEAPLRYDGGPLTLTAPREDPLTSVIKYAEVLAAERAKLSERQRVLQEAREQDHEEHASALLSLQRDREAAVDERDRLMACKIDLERRLTAHEGEIARLGEALAARDIQLSTRAVRVARWLESKVERNNRSA